MAHDRRIQLTLVALLIIGCVLIVLAMRWGIGIQPDSAGYIGTAQNLLDGYGLIMPLASEEPVPLTIFPPLYPWVLAFSGLTGLPLQQAAVLVNIVLLGLNSLLFCGMIHALTNGSWGAVLVGGILFVFSIDILHVHTMVLTEGLFILTGFGSLWLVAAYIRRGQMVFVVIAALLAGLALLTRFAGYAFIGVSNLALLIAPGSLIRRLTAAAVFGLLSVAPLVLWNGSTQQTYGAGTGRSIAFHPPTSSDLQTGLFSVLRWLFPEAWILAVVTNPLLLAAAGVLLVILLWAGGRYLWRLRKSQTPADGLRWLRGQPPLALILALFAVSYPAFLIISLTFFDAFTPLTNRILLPTYIALLVLVVYGGWLLAGAVQRQPVRVRRGLLALAVVLVCLQIGRGIEQVYTDYAVGIGFRAQVWRDSATVGYVRNQPDSTVIYSNNPEALYLLTDRSTWMFPRQYSPQTLHPNPTYAAEMDQMAERLRSGDGLIVFFYSDNSVRDHFPGEAELQDRYMLERVLGDEAGTVYRLPP